jgi:AcrR family transcriptional regulator
MSPGGRRPGKSNARDDIVRAATEAFARDGYDGTSLRAVARAAGVDAALVHHYFDGKDDLFMATMVLHFDARPAPLDDKAAAIPSDFSGSAMAEGFLAMWDGAEGTGSSFVSCVGAMAASRAVAEAVRQLMQDRVWRHVPPVDGEDTRTIDIRRALVASHLMGLATTRYVLRAPPISTASPGRIGRWVGPTLERYVSGPLD